MENTPLTTLAKNQAFRQKAEIIKYFTGEYKGKYKENNDLSYKTWVAKDENFQALCKEFEIFSSKGKVEVLELHDFDCELKLLKWITEDKAHRDKLVSLPSNCSQLNRFPEIIPYAYNTVYYSSPEGPNCYVNASYIDGPFDSDYKLFIATQNPLVNTFDHFWQMVFYKNVKTIIMFSGDYEEDRNKAECYWPDEKGDVIILGKLKIELADEPTPVIEKSLIMRQFKITNQETKKEIEVYHLLVTCWDEHSNMKNDFELKIIDYLFSFVEQSTPANPCVIHCNDGIGRTGSFIAIYNIYKCINEQRQAKSEGLYMNVFNVVRSLREQRIGMVNDKVLYENIYKVTIDLIKGLSDN